MPLGYPHHIDTTSGTCYHVVVGVVSYAENTQAKKPKMKGVECMAMANIAGKISFHVGKKLSISHNLGKERTSPNWNKDGHINAERTPLNVVLTNTPLKDFFKETFGEAIKKYNAANEKKHPDRVTDVNKYYNDQKGKAQEAIFQMSDHDNYLKMVNEVGQQCADEIHKAYLTDIYNQWVKENPSLKVFSATIHMDETKDGAPHLHLDFIPIAESSRGLTKKLSMDGAMKQLGFIRESKQKYAETPYKQWLNTHRERVEHLAERYITVIPSEPSMVGHQQPQEWKAQECKRSAVQKITEAFALKKTIASAQAIIDNAEDIKRAAAQEAKKITDGAKVKQLKSEKCVDELKKEAEALKQEYTAIKEKINSRTDYWEKSEKRIKTKILELTKKEASIDQTVEAEVQARLSMQDFINRQKDEDVRYRRKVLEKFHDNQHTHDIPDRPQSNTQRGR